ncbi:hypothetical protein AFCDBAGC_3905 [Methylobacterium cerastii]|uniref:Uncharacterized protein n=1 Tax=Methylobacterium cerastii TaxID=932741 RepID=A0ABQ4QM96_9HYPH|nr:hypothetical protein AFCDBAGC_3905 [Methylobacterium cerastii]
MSVPLRLLSCQVTTKPPFDSPVTVELSWSFAVAVLTRNSSPTVPPVALKTCALIPEPLLSPPTPLKSDQVTTKPPFDRPVTVELNWSLAVVVLTRNSPPAVLPSAL